MMTTFRVPGDSLTFLTVTPALSAVPTVSSTWRALILGRSRKLPCRDG